MSNVVPFQNGNVPAFLRQVALSPEQIAQMNQGAAMGTGGGGSINKISLKAARFRLIVGGKETYVIPAMNINVAIVRVNDGISKTWYEKEWTGQGEADAPDCSSDDGIRPRADAPKKQCGADGLCQNCPQNQWGSKINRLTGAQIKACSDTKRMAIVAPGADGRFTSVKDMYQLSVPAASLKDFGGYIRQLSAQQIPVAYNMVVTDVSFDPNVSFPKLLFKPVRYLEQDEYEAINEKYNEDDTKRVAGMGDAQAMNTAPAPQPVQQPVHQQPQYQSAPIQNGTQQLAYQQPAQQQPVYQQQAPVQQPQDNGWGNQAQQPQYQQAPVQQPVQQPQDNGWGNPAPVQQQAPVQQPAQQPQDNGWGNPAPVAQQAPVQHVEQQPQVQQAPVQRERGKPSPGKSRRTKEEMAEDEAWEAAQKPQQQAPIQQQAPVQQAPVQDNGWGNPAPVVQQQAPVQQQPQVQQGGWEQAPQQAPAQQPVAQQLPPVDPNNPWGQAPGVAPQQGAPIQPNVAPEAAANAFAGWDD